MKRIPSWLRLGIIAEDDAMADLKLAGGAMVCLIVLFVFRWLV